jgi:IMP dehydrogenase
MELSLSWNDVLIKPQWSTVKSRKDVDVSTTVAGQNLSLGILSSNMDSVTDSSMCNAMHSAGGKGILHRFWSIEDNVNAFSKSSNSTWCSVGVGNKELERALSLYDAGCGYIVLDVAHGAAQHVVDQTKRIMSALPDINLIVGNFATARSINDFNYHLGYNVSAYKVNIGSGSACTTRMVTGCGLPSYTSLKDCVSTGFDIIQDGGITNSGDFSKAMGLGAKACILGRLLAGCEESPAKVRIKYIRPDEARGFQSLKDEMGHYIITHKHYRGSASHSSYKTQGKVADHRVAEGESFLVPYSGSVKGVLNQLEAGLRSGMSYVGAHNLVEFKERCEFMRVTSNGQKESQAHGKQ